MELKGLRDDCCHVKSKDAYSSDSDAEVLFAHLLVADLQRFENAVSLVMDHYGDAPRSVSPSTGQDEIQE